jgi:hypothetical protein
MDNEVNLSFRLPDSFVKDFETREVPWGFKDKSGNSIGELTFLRTYARLKPDGTKERWHEVCRRVIEGMYSITKDHCLHYRLPWNEKKARFSAYEAYERMFNMKWLPPGRGLWMMGTKFVHDNGNSAALQNCAFVSTEEMTKLHPEKPYAFLMEASMLGIGVGFDTEGAKKDFKIHQPVGEEVYQIPDSREGWVESVSRVIRAFLVPNTPLPILDYSLVRPAGEPIKGFGGLASGPAPLKQLHERLVEMFSGRDDSLTTRDIVDICNMIGTCIVAGNVRRTALIALGDPEDDVFRSLKDLERYPERAPYAWTSNNSLKARAGLNYDPLVETVEENGEPGFAWLDIARQYGRLLDPPDNRDYRVKGFNPCAEQTLESFECCTLVEVFMPNCTDKEDFLRTLKFSYLYAKAVTLLPTHWPETNAVMQRNRRIGNSVSGLAQFVETIGWAELREWLDDGYAEICRRDRAYSEWLGIRESIKKTSVKPSGTVSLVAGVTPGAHWPVEDTYIRRIRLAASDPIAQAMMAAGYHVEPDLFSEGTLVVEIPIKGPNVRSEKEVPLFEKAALAVLAQRYWADNAVSCTLTFDPEKEKDQIATILRMNEGHLKAISFLPMKSDAYAQMPYEAITLEKFDSLQVSLPLGWEELYSNGMEALGERGCGTDKCELKIGA